MLFFFKTYPLLNYQRAGEIKTLTPTPYLPLK